MSVTIELDLKEVLAKIDQRLDKIDQKLDNFGKDITELKVGFARIEEKVDGLEKRLEGKIDGLETKLEGKIDGLGKRLDNQEFLSRGVLIGLIVAILGGFAKLFGFVGVH